MPLPPPLQAIFDALMTAYPRGLTLDELSDELVTKPVTHADIELIIGALEDAGVDLEAPARPAQPAELARVLTAARELMASAGKRPTPEEIARHTGLTAPVVRRALLLAQGVQQKQKPAKQESAKQKSAKQKSAKLKSAKLKSAKLKSAKLKSAKQKPAKLKH